MRTVPQPFFRAWVNINREHMVPQTRPLASDIPDSLWKLSVLISVHKHDIILSSVSQVGKTYSTTIMLACLDCKTRTPSSATIQCEPCGVPHISSSWTPSHPTDSSACYRTQQRKHETCGSFLIYWIKVFSGGKGSEAAMMRNTTLLRDRKE